MGTQLKSSRSSFSKAFAFGQFSLEQNKRRLLRGALRPSEERDLAFRRTILSIPFGRVSTYGAIAAAAGYPRYHRAVARLLGVIPFDSLPWQRVVGAGGEIKLWGEAADEQRARLRLEGVRFKGKKVDMSKFEHLLKTLGVLLIDAQNRKIPATRPALSTSISGVHKMDLVASFSKPRLDRKSQYASATKMAIQSGRN